MDTFNGVQRKFSSSTNSIVGTFERASIQKKNYTESSPLKGCRNILQYSCSSLIVEFLVWRIVPHQFCRNKNFHSSTCALTTEHEVAPAFPVIVFVYPPRTPRERNGPTIVGDYFVLEPGPAQNRARLDSWLQNRSLRVLGVVWFSLAKQSYSSILCGA